MSHHKNQYQITHRIKRLLSELNQLVQGTASDADAAKGGAGGQYYRGKAHGVGLVAELVLEHLGPVCEEPLGTGYVAGNDRDCPMCGGKDTFKVLQTVPDDGLPGSIFGCMQCGWEDRLTR